jgi:hypothetical protein
MIDELETIWKASFVTQSRLHTITCLDRMTETKKTSIRLVGDLAEIRNTKLPHTSLQHYCYTNPFGVNA